MTLNEGLYVLGAVVIVLFFEKYIAHPLWIPVRKKVVKE
jgi:hypothetical protein